VWNVFEAQWMEQYNKLQAYLEKHDSKWPPSKTSLGIWVRDQRQLYRREEKPLTPERIDLLNQLGMVWDTTNLFKNNATSSTRN